MFSYKDVAPIEFIKGVTYITSVAEWTIEDISPSGMVFVRREDGLRAQFGKKTFADMILAVKNDPKDEPSGNL